MGNVIDINDLILKNIIIDKITLKDIIIYHVRYDASYTVKLLYIAFQKIDWHVEGDDNENKNQTQIPVNKEINTEK